jgi:hypothetical protein
MRAIRGKSPSITGEWNNNNKTKKKKKGELVNVCVALLLLTFPVLLAPLKKKQNKQTNEK